MHIRQFLRQLWTDLEKYFAYCMGKDEVVPYFFPEGIYSR